MELSGSLHYGNNVAPSLCIEYAENGSLFGFLQQSQINLDRDLKWAEEIAQGEYQGPCFDGCMYVRTWFLIMHGEGLHYLHHEAPESIIHGDLKSSNGACTLEAAVNFCIAS